MSEMNENQTARCWLSPRETIAEAAEVVCSDGNSDRFRVADDIIAALTDQGFCISGASGLDKGLEHSA